VAAGIDVNVTNVDFASVADGAKGAATTLTLTSATDGQITGPLSITVSDADFVVDAGTATGDCGYSTFAAGLDGTTNKTCKIYVFFAPKSLTTTAMTGTVKIIGSNMETATQIYLTGTPATPITATSAGTSFSSTALGATSTALSVDFTLASGVYITGQLTAALGGANASDFRITSDTCTGTTLYADATSVYAVANPFSGTATTCTVSLKFVPTSGTGSKTAKVTLSGTPGDSVSKAFTGTATAVTN
jgi:hypothetical protein